MPDVDTDTDTDSTGAPDEGVNCIIINNKSVVRRCSGGDACLAQRVALIEHFCSKAAANIRGLGGSKIRDLVYVSFLQE